MLRLLVPEEDPRPHLAIHLMSGHSTPGVRDRRRSQTSTLRGETQKRSLHSMFPRRASGFNYPPPAASLGMLDATNASGLRVNSAPRRHKKPTSEHTLTHPKKPPLPHNGVFALAVELRLRTSCGCGSRANPFRHTERRLVISRQPGVILRNLRLASLFYNQKSTFIHDRKTEFRYFGTECE